MQFIQSLEFFSTYTTLLYLIFLFIILIFFPQGFGQSLIQPFSGDILFSTKFIVGHFCLIHSPWCLLADLKNLLAPCQFYFIYLFFEPNTCHYKLLLVTIVFFYFFVCALFSSVTFLLCCTVIEEGFCCLWMMYPCYMFFKLYLFLLHFDSYMI